jgi:gamma-glutamylcyclotransferase (GGCT)/AIG2-like uncharacterized protein YtfP
MKHFKTNLLFGYGSLRSDLDSYSSPPAEIYRNRQGKFSKKPCESLGFGTITGELWKIKNKSGVWAGVVEVDRKDFTVYGEVFKIDDFGLIDTREGVNRIPPCYYRKIVTVKLNRKSVKAWVYFVNTKDAKLIEFVPNGDWKFIVDRQPNTITQ